MKLRIILVLSLLGVFNTAYLLWTHTSPLRPMLCVGSGCDEVRDSPYSVVFGLPLPLFGLIMYAVLALLVFTAPLASTRLRSVARYGRYGMVAIAASGFTISLYLTALEAFVIHAWCVWCVVSALIITFIFAVSIGELRRPSLAQAGNGSEIIGQARIPTVRLEVTAYLMLVAVAAVLSVPAWLYLTRPGEPVGPQGVADENVGRLNRPESHWLGSENPELVIVEFADLECSSCAKVEPVVKRIRETYGDKVRYTLRHFPISVRHPHAWKAAEAAECAGEQGKFWEAVETFFHHQKELQSEALKTYAQQIGLDMESFSQCLDAGKMEGRVTRDRDDGLALGVKGTPTFFVGQKPVTGRISYARFSRLVEEVLNQPIAGGLTPTPTTASYSSEDGIRDNEVNSLPKAPPAVPAARQEDLRDESGNAPAPAAGAGGPLPESSLWSDSGGPFSGLGGSFGACTEDLPPEPPRIGTEAAYLLYRQDGIFVDVRDPEPYRAGHIRGAMNLPITHTETGLQKLPRDKKIVIYGQATATGDPCAESRATGRALLGNGFSEELLSVFADGYEAWKKAGYPVENGP